MKEKQRGVKLSLNILHICLYFVIRRFRDAILTTWMDGCAYDTTLQRLAFSDVACEISQKNSEDSRAASVRTA